MGVCEQIGSQEKKKKKKQLLCISPDLSGEARPAVGGVGGQLQGDPRADGPAD